MMMRVHDTGNRPKMTKVQLKKVDGRELVVTGSKVPLAGCTPDLYTLGKEDATAAEEERTKIILSILQGSDHFSPLSLTRGVFFGGSKRPATKKSYTSTATSLPTLSTLSGCPLNSSQERAVQHILSRKPGHRIIRIKGPPGTGKTRVIARAVLETHGSMWLTAQSNVAVKNIAEKLASVGFWDFKLLVSKDFHFDWYAIVMSCAAIEVDGIFSIRHEHLYRPINDKVLRSDKFGKDIVENERLLQNARVILCTLSMFSSSRLQSCGFTQLVPVNNVIIDEASQIEIGAYLPLLSKFGQAIRKLAFIGDDKQCTWYARMSTTLTEEPYFSTSVWTRGHRRFAEHLRA